MTVNVPTADEFAALVTREAAAEARIAASEIQTAANTAAVSDLTTKVAALGAVPPPAPAPERTPLRVVLNLGGGQLLTFDESKAANLGDYIGPFVHQRCLRQVIGAFVVDFRLDADGKREEIVFEYGSLVDFSTLPPKPVSGVPGHCAPYTATISGGSLTAPLPITLSAPHWWQARWRWQSAPRPQVRTWEQLIAMKAIFPLDKNQLWGAVPITVAREWRGPMDTADLNPFMPDPGERGDVGPWTEWQAQASLGNAAAAVTMMSQAEATGTMTFHVRDAATGGPVDTTAHPFVSFGDADSYGRYQLPLAPQPAGAPTNYFWLDQAHMPNTALLPYLLTDDPYLLEEAQFQAQFAFMEANYRALNEIPKLPGLLSTTQPRGFAWALNLTFYQAAFAPEVTPSWLHNRQYWKDSLTPSLTYANKFLAATESPCTTVFGAITFCNMIQTFMMDYLGIVLARASWTKLFPEWDPVFRYAATIRMAMSDNTGASGWPSEHPCPYKVPLSDARLGAAAGQDGNINYSVPASPNTPTSFKELFACYCKFAGVDPTDSVAWPPGKLTPLGHIYYPEMLGTLGAFAQAGLPGARERFLWMQEHMKAEYADGISGSEDKWGIPAPMGV